MAERLAKPRVHHFVQAPVRPLDQDGIVVGIVGTGAFALLSIALWFSEGWLISSGHQWWLWTGIAGTLLGVVGTAYAYLRKHRRTRIPPPA